MAARHGTRRGYGEGCRCDDCKDAQRLYQRRYREWKAYGETRPHSAPAAVAQLPPAELQPAGPGPVEAATKQEIAGLAAQTRPGLVAIALAMARILDSSRAASAQPAAAKLLVTVLDTLHKGSAQGRRGKLAVVKSMTTSSPSV
jgi:hypothetical protein